MSPWGVVRPFQRRFLLVFPSILLPCKVCIWRSSFKINSICRTYLWAESEKVIGGKFKLNWESVSKQEDYGGLEILNLKIFYSALRLIWLS